MSYHSTHVCIIEIKMVKWSRLIYTGRATSFFYYNLHDLSNFVLVTLLQSSHMLLDHCYAFGLLLLPSGMKKFFKEGDPTPPPHTQWYHVKGLVTRNTHVQYESPISPGLKVLAKVRVFVHTAKVDARAMT